MTADERPSQSIEPTSEASGLHRSLGAWQLWGIAVGLVISGDYFGWSYGWGHAGTLGFLITTGVVAIFYAVFVLCYTELCCAIPHAGGPFAYAQVALGRRWAALAGCAGLLAYVLVPPAVALAIGAYVGINVPGLEARWGAWCAFAVFVVLNMRGVRLAASFELVITLLAVVELLVFAGVVAPGFAWSRFVAGGWAGQDSFSPQVLPGVLAALPFAIWFFFGIEGAAMAAEEVKSPQRAVPRALLWGLLTLLGLALLVMVMAGGVGDWRALSNINDPLPQAMLLVVGGQSGWLHMLVGLGLLGLVASFHGFLLSGSRQMYAMAREGFLPAWLGVLHPRWRTPHRALGVQGLLGAGLVALDNNLSWAGQSLTANLVTLSVLACLVMYAVSMAALLRLRLKQPDLTRPFVAPFHPWSALLAGALALAFTGIVAWLNPFNALLFGAALATLTFSVHRR